MTEININCFILTETNLTRDESDPFFLEGYNKFVLDRIKVQETGKYKKKGSGIFLFLENNLKNVSVNYNLSKCTNDGEFLVVQLSLNKQTIYIVGVYRPPSGNILNFIENFDKIMESTNKDKNSKLYVLGDFNINLYNTSSNYVNQYVDSMFSNNLYPTISRATHFMGLNPTCIDHILTNDILNVKTSGILIYNISHHMPTFLFTKLENNYPDSLNSDRKHRICINETTLAGF